MINKTLIILFSTVMGMRAASPEWNPSGKSIPGEVGMAGREFFDSSRSNWLGNGARPIRVDIWYPSEANSGKEEMINDQNQFSEPVRMWKEARLSSGSKKYPLILISHGSYGNAAQMRWLAYYLAANGYISVAINHNGTAAEEKQLEFLTLSEFCMWERPRDVSVVLDKMFSDPDFGAFIDRSRIGVAGFSLGGATAIWTGGAILDMDTLKANAPELPPAMKQLIERQIEMTKGDILVQQSLQRAGNSYKDERIKAIFALAPAIGFGFTRDGLKDVRIPVQIVVGDRDMITPMETNARRYSEFIKNAKLIVLPGERGHFTENFEGNEHATELEEVSRIALKFFQENLQ